MAVGLPLLVDVWKVTSGSEDVALAGASAAAAGLGVGGGAPPLLLAVTGLPAWSLSSSKPSLRRKSALSSLRLSLPKLRLSTPSRSPGLQFPYPTPRPARFLSQAARCLASHTLLCQLWRDKVIVGVAAWQRKEMRALLTVGMLKAIEIRIF